MKLQLFLVLYLVLSSFCITDPVFVIEVAREGLTTPKVPLISLQSDIELTEYNDTLSEYGRQQQYLLGLEMHTRYWSSIFQNKCNPLNIFAYSVSKESIMLSGQMQLFGICPLGSNQDITPEMVEKAFPPFDFPEKRKIAKELGLQATPYNFLPLPLHSTYNDPVFGVEGSDEHSIPSTDLPSHEASIDRNFKGLYHYLARLAGLDVDEVRASNILDTVNELLWLVRTKKLKNVNKEVVYEAEEFVYQYYKHYWNKSKRDKYAHMFFKEVIAKLKNAVVSLLNKHLEKPLPFSTTIEKPDYDPGQIKYFLFEVGDLQMYTYTNVLRFGNDKFIPPSSILIFELHQTRELNKEMSLEEAMGCFKVSMKFNDWEIESPFCRSPCKLGSFYERIKEYFGKVITEK